jgi:hypothetical protein
VLARFAVAARSDIVVVLAITTWTSGS